MRRAYALNGLHTEEINFLEILINILSGWWRVSDNDSISKERNIECTFYVVRSIILTFDDF